MTPQISIKYVYSREIRLQLRKQLNREMEKKSNAQNIQSNIVNKKNHDSPGVQEHVEGKPPEFEPLVWSVNKDTVDRHRPRGIHLTHRYCIVREESKL